MKLRRLAIVLASMATLTLLVSITSACQQQAAAPASQPTASKVAPKATTAVNIALFTPLTGSQVDLGTMSRNAAQMAVDDINAQGGIKSLGGAKVNLVVADITSDAAQVPTVVERTVSQNNISDAVGCGISQFTLSALPVMEKKGVPMVTSSIADNITQQGYKDIFQIAPKGSAFGKMQIDFLSFLKKKYNIPTDKLGFIYENTAYGTSTASGLRKIAEQQGYKVVFDQSYPAGFSDASPLVTALRSSGADAVFPVSYTQDATLIVTTMHQMKYLPVMIGGGAGFIWPDIYKSLGDKVNGIFSVGSWSWDSKNITSDPQRVDITKRYKDKFGTYMPEQAGEHYAAVWLIKDALEAAGSADPAKVRDAMAKLNITTGPAALMQPGVIKFDENGMSTQVSPTMIQWQKGEPRTVYPENVQNVDVVWPIK